MRYAGDVSPQEAWNMLSSDPAAQLIDVRTRAEWAFVGIPDLSTLERTPVMIEWQAYPAMSLNPDFVAETLKHVSADTPTLFLCRSGGRSAAAAAAATAAGLMKAYNVASGFEGDHDKHGHRGNLEGWKAAGLPWRQG